MSSSPTIGQTQGGAAQARMLLLPAAAVVTVVAVAFHALGIYGDGSVTASHSTEEFLIGCGYSVAAALVVFGLVAPWSLRGESTAPVALTLSILGAVFAFFFWAGLTPAFAVGGVLLGRAGLDAAKGNGMSRAAFVIGILAVLGYIAGYVAAWMSTNGIF